MAKRAYSLNSVILVINGINIKAGGESEGITFEWNSDVYEETVDARGQVHYTRVSDDLMRATVRVMQGSQAYTALAGLQQAQQAPLPVIPPMALVMTDPSNGDTLEASTVVFLNRPTPNKRKGPSELEYRLSIPNPSWVYGPLNASPPVL